MGISHPFPAQAEAARPEFSDGRAALEALPEGVAAAKMLDVALRLCRRHGDAEKRQSDADPRGAAWNSNLRPDFNVSVCACFDASSSAVLRELDESNRFVQKSAESTSM